MKTSANLEEARSESKAARDSRPYAQVVGQILSRYRCQPSDLVPVLQEVQHELRHLPQGAMAQIARALNLSPATVFGVATFYAQFSLEPKGEYVIRVCDGTACHVSGSTMVRDEIARCLGLGDSASMTPDGLFSLETVSCLGACGLAPVMTVNDRVFGELTPGAIASILDDLRAEAQRTQRNKAEEVDGNDSCAA